MKLFKILHKDWKCVYPYQTGDYFMIEFKTYVDSLELAEWTKEVIENILEGFEADEK